MPHRSDFGIPCCLRPTEAGSALRSTLFEATFTFTVVTARRLVVSPRETLSIGFRILISLHPAIQTTGRLTFAPAGLPPAEHTSLNWTHSRTARFPGSGLKPRLSSVGLSRGREVETLGRIRPFRPWFAPGLVSRPIWASRRFYQAGHPTDEETARCPEPLCPTLVLPPLGRCRVHLLRGRCPPVLAHTGSCATPLGLSPPSALSLVRRVLAGCTQPLLPTGASRRYL